MGRKLKYNEEEGGMAKAQLQKIEMYAAKLNEMIHPEDELEGWVQNKLSVVAAYMGDVKHYLDYALQNEPEYEEFGEGGMTGKPRYWEVEFTWDSADDESRKVNVMADSVSEAEEQVRKKFAPYYEGLKVVEVEEDKEVSWEEYSSRPQKFEIESTTDYETIEADDEDDAREKWMKRRSGDTIKSEIVSVKRKFSDGGKVQRHKDALIDQMNQDKDARYKVSIFYGGEMEDEVVYTDSLSEAKRISSKGEHAEIYDRKEKQFVDIMADGGKVQRHKDALIDQMNQDKEDEKEAEAYIGTEIWETLSEQDKLNATQYLRAKGVIGYIGQEQTIMDLLAEESYSKGGSLYRGFRPSPSISATAYPKGFKMIGNDGNLWEISLDSRGVHRWTKSHSNTSRDEVIKQKAKIREAIELLESMRGDIDVEDEINSLKKLQ